MSVFKNFPGHTETQNQMETLKIWLRACADYLELIFHLFRLLLYHSDDNFQHDENHEKMAKQRKLQEKWLPIHFFGQPTKWSNYWKPPMNTKFKTLRRMLTGSHARVNTLICDVSVFKKVPLSPYIHEHENGILKNFHPGERFLSPKTPTTVERKLNTDKITAISKVSGNA